MTIGEMHTEFKLLMDKGDSLGNPNFMVSEIDAFLNIAIEKFVSKRMYGNNPRRTGFDEDQKRRDDLRNLIENDTITAFTTGTLPNGNLVTLPTGYRHAIQESVTVGGGRVVSVTPLTYDRYNKIIDDPFNKPDLNTVYRVDFNTDQFELLHHPDVALTGYNLRYITDPAVVDNISVTTVNCDLAAHTHKEIVRMAVVDALENVEQPRYQSSKIELNEIE